MPRHARFRIAGCPLHIRQRGVDKARCFFEPSHQGLFLGLLSELAPRFECRVHAYVLMTNHVHLLLTPECPSAASVLMKHVGQRYTQYINRSRSRCGPLWEGRFRSSLVDSETYLLHCYRYVEANPVRAGIVAHPAQYPWSSFAANALGEASPLITPHPTYEQLGCTPAERQSEYLRSFESGLPVEALASIRAAIGGGFALGSAAFVEQMQQLLGARIVAARPGRPARAETKEKRGLSPV